jgi:hypothetical protein
MLIYFPLDNISTHKCLIMELPWQGAQLLVSGMNSNMLNFETIQLVTVLLFFEKGK